MNPLRRLFDAGLPEVDLGVMQHGFAEHGRDYVFILEDSISAQPGTYRLILTHVVELKYATALPAEAWKHAWSEEFTDYAAWEAAGEPEGYVFGTNWSLAYPGFDLEDNDKAARTWSDNLGHPMHAASIETDRFKLKMVFHDAWLEKIGDDAPTVSKALIPLK